MVVKVNKVKNINIFRNWVCVEGKSYSLTSAYVSPTLRYHHQPLHETAIQSSIRTLGPNKESFVLKGAMPFHGMSKIHLRNKIQAQGHTRGQTHAIPIQDLVLDMLCVERDGSERGSEANSIRSDEAQLQHQISFEDLKWRSLSIPHYESYLNVAFA